MFSFGGSTATPGTEFIQARHTVLLMFRRSEMSSIGALSYLVSYATSEDLFYCYISSREDIYLYFMFLQRVFFCSLHPTVSPFAFLAAICLLTSNVKEIAFFPNEQCFIQKNNSNVSKNNADI